MSSGKILPINVTVDSAGPINNDPAGLNLNIGNGLGLDVGTGGIDANTLLCLHLDNNIIDSSSYAHVLSNTGVITYDASGEFSQAYSNTVLDAIAYFTNTPAFDFSASNFTVDCWIKPASTGAQQYIYGQGQAGVGGWDFSRDSSGTLQFNNYVGGVFVRQSTAPAPVGVWTHVAVEVVGTTMNFYVNGVLSGSSSFTGPIDYNPAYICHVGGYAAPNDGLNFNGSIDELRVSNVARYNGVSFTPPLAPYSSSGAPSLITDVTTEDYTPTTPADWSVVPTTVQEALDNVAAEVAAIPPPTSTTLPTFVYQPSGTAGGNVFTSWASLYTALSALQGPKVIEIDNTFASPVSIPAGTYDLSDTYLSGVKGYIPSAAQIEVSNGVVLRNCLGLINNLYFNSQATSNIFTYTNPAVADREFVIKDGSILEGTNTAPILITGTYNVRLLIDGLRSRLAYKGVDNQGSVSLKLNLFNGGSVDADAVITAGNVVVTKDAGSTISATQVNIGGTITTILKDESEQVNYSPTTPGDWSSVPTQVKAALDTLAADLAALPTALTPNLETFTLTAPDIANGYVELAHPSNHAVTTVILEGAAPLIQGVGYDFELTEPVTNTRITFSGTIVAGMSVGQKVQVNYWY